jgi:hypothetical protein
LTRAVGELVFSPVNGTNVMLGLEVGALLLGGAAVGP